jgi:tRNA-dihydrouridine synthase
MVSPMEGVSDGGFRNMCYRLGVGLTWTEMVRAAAVMKNNAATLDLIDTYSPPEVTPTGVQLLVKSPVELINCLQKIEELAANGLRPHFNNIVAIDINLGCPSLDVIREGGNQYYTNCMYRLIHYSLLMKGGPALLKRKKRLGEIFTTLSDWKKSTSLPNIGAVGCKIRLGLNAKVCYNNFICIYSTSLAFINAYVCMYICIYVMYIGM